MVKSYILERGWYGQRRPLRVWSAFFLGISVATALSGCLSLPRPFHVQVITVKGEPIEGATVEVDSPVGAMIGQTDDQGVQSFFGFLADRSSINITKEGFYRSKTKYFHRSKARIPLRPRISPALTLDEDVSVDLPDTDGVFYYDVIQADLVQPHGSGIHKDFRFTLKTYKKKYKYEDKKSTAVKGKFEAVGEGNGFLPLFTPKENLPRSFYPPDSFELPHRAPESGYLRSIEAAKSKAPRDNEGDIKPWVWHEGGVVEWRRPIKEGYLFKIRTNSDAGPIYGRIFDLHDFGAHEEQGGYVNFSYRVNLERTRSMEISELVSQAEGTATDPEETRGRSLPVIKLKARDLIEESE